MAEQDDHTGRHGDSPSDEESITDVFDLPSGFDVGSARQHLLESHVPGDVVLDDVSESRKIGGLVDFAIACYPGPGGIRTRWTSELPLREQSERLISAGCRISGRAISERPGYPAISKREMPYRLTAFTEKEVDMTALGFKADPIGLAGTELIRPADPTIFLTASAAGYTDRTDDIITANALLRADMRNDDDAASLAEVRNRLQFLADTGYDLRWNLPS